MNLFGLREETHNGINIVRNNQVFSNWSADEARTYIDDLYPEEREGLKAFVAEGGVVLFDDEVNKHTRALFSFSKDDKGDVRPIIAITRRAWGVKGAVIHELTHYEQYKRGDLTLVGSDILVYKGHKVGHPLSWFVFFGEAEREARDAQAALIAKHTKRNKKLLGFEVTARIFIGI